MPHHDAGWFKHIEFLSGILFRQSLSFNLGCNRVIMPIMRSVAARVPHDPERYLLCNQVAVLLLLFSVSQALSGQPIKTYAVGPVRRFRRLMLPL